MANPPKNVAASVRARLLTSPESASALRPSPHPLRAGTAPLSPRLDGYRDRFVLKGAMLMATWVDNPVQADARYRPSRPGQFRACRALASSRRSPPSRRRRRHLRPGRFKVDRIRDENEYGGVRMKAQCHVDRLPRVPVANRYRIRRRHRARRAGNRLAGAAGFSGAQAGVSARDRHRREIPGDGHARPRQRPDERLLRRLGAVRSYNSRATRWPAPSTRHSRAEKQISQPNGPSVLLRRSLMIRRSSSCGNPSR